MPTIRPSTTWHIIQPEYYYSDTSLVIYSSGTAYYHINCEFTNGVMTIRNVSKFKNKKHNGPPKQLNLFKDEELYEKKEEKS